MKKRNFKQGELVISRDTATYVLVTGRGAKDAGYPCFSGVVVAETDTGTGEYWGVGMYSETWGIEAFAKCSPSVAVNISNPELLK